MKSCITAQSPGLTAYISNPSDASSRNEVGGGGFHQPAPFEPVLTSEEAARLLNIHPKTLQRMARKGQVPARRIGDLWRFRASELDAWFRGKSDTLGTPLVP